MMSMPSLSPTVWNAVPALDSARCRQDFPILHRKLNGHPLIYLDNAATSQKPWSVLEAEHDYYVHCNANIHRGIHSLSQEATEAFEAVRDKVRDSIHAARREEIIFTRSATESINLVASSYGQCLQAGDEILISEMEHHSNIVPWQLLCQRTGALLRVAPMDDAGQLMIEQFARLLSQRTRLVALTHMSNALGSINPVKTLIDMAHHVGALVLLDGAQAVAHLPINVTDLDCDFYVFSGHKLYGPTGTGVLYARLALLEAMPPYQGGGDMIQEVTFDGSSWNELPYKFEAGTPNIAGVIGLGAAIDYVHAIGLDCIHAHEAALLHYATEQAARFPGMTVIGTAANKGAILSFSLAGIHPHDIGTILDSQGICVRTGHHCAMPVMAHFGLPATVRASFALYNTTDEVDSLFHSLGRVKEIFR